MHRRDQRHDCHAQPEPRERAAVRTPFGIDLGEQRDPTANQVSPHNTHAKYGLNRERAAGSAARAIAPHAAIRPIMTITGNCHAGRKAFKLNASPSECSSAQLYRVTHGVACTLASWNSSRA